MGRLVSLLSLLVLAGCPTGDDTQDDDVNDGIDAGADGGGDVTGIVLTWRAQPALPATVDDAIIVQSMRFGFTDLRLVGDVGPVPVDRTELVWSPGVTPANDLIEGAPAGVYSSLQAMIAAPNPNFAFEIQGTYNGTPFSLRDTRALPVVVTFDEGLSLVAGGGLVIDLRVDVDDLAEEIDFTTLPLQNGTLVLGPGNEQIAALQAAVAAAFEVSDD